MTSATATSREGRPPGRYPFRLATTSYIHPSGYAENIERLAGSRCVDEVEVVLFEGADASLPSEKEVRAMAAAAARAALRLHVHLPLDMRLGHPDPVRRGDALRTLTRVMRRVEPLCPDFFVLHLEWDGPAEPDDDAVRRWQRRTADTLEAAEARGVDLRRCCVETLLYPPLWVDSLRREFGMPLCLDVGHLLLTGDDPTAFFREHFGQVRTVHLYGPKPGGRHGSLDGLAEPLLTSLVGLLRDFRGVVSLEVFRLADLESSLVTLEAAWRGRKGENGGDG